MANEQKSKMYVNNLLVLGIETSCDETGIALYHASKGLIDHKLYSQVELHHEYGGVVPELASRDHIRKIIPLIQEILNENGLTMKDVGGIAYTAGPGLVGALMVGAAIGQTLAYTLNIPAVGVHHMEGHLLAPMLETRQPRFPFIALLVSGGHTQLIQVSAFGRYELLGETIDDSAGEAFDKIAKLLGLGYPGGAALAALALTGDPLAFNFPKPMLDRPGLDFSFSGLKTHVANTIAKVTMTEQVKADIAASFERAVVITLVEKCKRALAQTGLKNLVIAGGVSANSSLRTFLNDLMAEKKGEVFFPRLEFCTDNGAMIAYAGCQRLLRGHQESLQIKVYPRWSLTDLPTLASLPEISC